MKKRKVLLTLLVTTFLFGVAGCGTSNDKNESSAKQTEKQTEKQKDYSFYKDGKTNSRIYYKTDLEGKNFGKDTKIDAIIYIDHGNYTLYTTTNPEKTYTMGDLKGLSDKEVLSTANKWNEETMLAYVAEGKEKSQEGLNMGYRLPTSTEYETKNLELFDNYSYEKPETRKLQVRIASDETGNKTGKEWIILPKYESNIKYYLINDTKPALQAYYPGDSLWRWELSSTQGTAEVYDKSYNLSMLGQNYTLATLDTGLMTLDTLNEKGLLGEDDHLSPSFKTGTDDDGDKYLIW